MSKTVSDGNLLSFGQQFKTKADARYEALANKVTALSSSSTDTQYPSAKCVYDLVGDIETLLAAI